MSDSWQRTYDVFVTHAWRYHDDWNRFADLMNGVSYFRWRNFSLPWYDPAIDINTDMGKKLVAESLESQILPVNIAIALDSVFAVKSARRWLEEELRLARQHKKPVLAMPAFGAAEVSAELKSLCDGVLTWDGKQVADAIAKAVGES